MIDGYEITGTTYGSSIYIRHTDLYFKISNCHLENGYNGLLLTNVTNGEVFQNTIINHEIGINVLRSQEINITENTISNNTYGIFLDASGNNTITSNTLTKGGLFLFGYELSDFIQAEILSNTVDGKPIVYWKDSTGGVVPSGAGQIFLANCSFVDIITYCK